MKNDWSYTLKKGTRLNCSPFSKNTDKKFSWLKIQAVPNLIQIISHVTLNSLMSFQSSVVY